MTEYQKAKAEIRAARCVRRQDRRKRKKLLRMLRSGEPLSKDIIDLHESLMNDLRNKPSFSEYIIGSVS